MTWKEKIEIFADKNPETFWILIFFSLVLLILFVFAGFQNISNFLQPVDENLDENALVFCPDENSVSEEYFLELEARGICKKTPVFIEVCEIQCEENEKLEIDHEFVSLNKSFDGYETVFVNGYFIEYVDGNTMFIPLGSVERFGTVYVNACEVVKVNNVKTSYQKICKMVGK